jgi:ABC-type sugar transport system ATPase subunit
MPVKLLQLSNIGKRFGANRVLESVSFDLFAGEVHVLAGENGAGKTTLIRILAGIYPEHEGTLELGGRSVRFRNPIEASRHGISVIHQELSLVESMSVADNICLGREAARAGGLWLDRRAQLERVGELCARLDLRFSREDLDRRAEQFPLSVKNRIEIAKALAGDARVIVMDEPTSALNHAEVERLFALIENLKGRGCGIIYITHKMEEIYRVADRITVLRDGRRVGTAAAADCPPPTLIRWMIGRDLAEQFAPRAGSPAAGGRAPRFVVSHFTVPRPGPGRPPAVEDLSIGVGAGEIVGFAGLQGAGCSELFNGLFGAYGAVCGGRVEIDGEPVRPESPGVSIRRGLAFLTGDRKGTGLVLGMSVERNMSLSSLVRVSPWGVLAPGLERSLAEHYVGALGIRLDSVDQETGALSGGNQQKVALAKWLATRPRVLLLEEPTRGVDVGAKHEIYRLLRGLAAEGLAILLISTELPELLGLCDRVVALHRGRVTGVFDRCAATPERVLAAAMGAEAPEGN